MAETGSDALRRALGGRAPEGLDSLADDERAHLAEAVSDARRRQARALALALAQGGERAVQDIPRLLRGPIRRLTG